MTEPREIAEQAEEIVDGLYHWQIHNANIGGAISSSHALVEGDACVLVDPVRLADDALAALPKPGAIVLTARCHQRAAWRYRRELGAEVWLPVDAAAADEEPDRRYAAGDTLPGGLVALRTPGPEWPHYSFLRAAEPGVLFCSDLIAHERRRRAALRAARVSRGPRRDAAQRRASPGAAVRDPVLRSRRAAGRRSQGGAAAAARVVVEHPGGRRRGLRWVSGGCGRLPDGRRAPGEFAGRLTGRQPGHRRPPADRLSHGRAYCGESPLPQKERNERAG